jgi:hypothetical protein
MGDCYTKGINLSTSKQINAVHFADDQTTIAGSGDNLQRLVFTLENIANLLEWKCHQKNMRQWYF